MMLDMQGQIEYMVPAQSHMKSRYPFTRQFLVLKYSWPRYRYIHLYDLSNCSFSYQSEQTRCIEMQAEKPPNRRTPAAGKDGPRGGLRLSTSKSSRRRPTVQRRHEESVRRRRREESPGMRHETERSGANDGGVTPVPGRFLQGVI
jgi:hypothetical protein